MFAATASAQVENVTHQMATMSKAAQQEKLGGPIALLKVQATQTFEFCAREASQVRTISQRAR